MADVRHGRIILISLEFVELASSTFGPMTNKLVVGFPNEAAVCPGHVKVKTFCNSDSFSGVSPIPCTTAYLSAIQFASEGIASRIS